MASLKAAIKETLLTRLHAREEIETRLATRVVRDGVSRYFAWGFDKEKHKVSNFLSSCRRGEFEYSFCPSIKTPCVYGSLYAFMLSSLFDLFENREESAAWIDHFDRYQSKKDGLFRDVVLDGDAFEHRGGWGEGWGAKHLAAHLVIPYAREKRIPPHAFKFVEPFFQPGAIENWLAGFTFDTQLWSRSNYIMNLYSVLQFMRDFMKDERAHDTVQKISQWLISNQNETTGMWHQDPLESRARMNEAIRGAYHYYPLFEYDRTEIPHKEAAIDVILKTQNSWGAFEVEGRPAGACEDIDALDPLIRFASQTGYRDADVRLSAQRAFVWLLACQNSDGGFSSIPEHGCHYGGHPLTTSQPNESNLFATWFRTLNIAYVTRYLGVDERYCLGRFPGYEIA